MKVTYQARIYQPDLVTGRYVRCQGHKGKYTFIVFETATCNNSKSMFYGRAGMGYTLREYVSDGSEIPFETRAQAIQSKTTVRWE